MLTTNNTQYLENGTRQTHSLYERCNVKRPFYVSFGKRDHGKVRSERHSNNERLIGNHMWLINDLEWPWRNLKLFEVFLIHIKGKGFPYSLPSVGPGADPGVQAVSPQATISHPLCARLPLLPARPAVIFPAAKTYVACNFNSVWCAVVDCGSCPKSTRSSPNNVLRVLQISSKSVPFRMSYSRTREHRFLPRRVNPLLAWSIAWRRTIHLLYYAEWILRYVIYNFTVGFFIKCTCVHAHSHVLSDALRSLRYSKALHCQFILKLWWIFLPRYASVVVMPLMGVASAVVDANELLFT